MTHDLLAEMTRQLGAVVEEVRVVDSRDGIYFGAVRLRVRGESAVRVIDSRPSDALALALRTGATIRVRRDLIEGAPQITFVPPGTREQVVRTLGLTIVAPSPELRASFRLPTRDGVIVIRAGGEGAAAGLRRGDLILEINGTVPAGPVAFLDAVRATPGGRPILLRFWRDGGEATVEVWRSRGEGIPEVRT